MCPLHFPLRLWQRVGENECRKALSHHAAVFLCDVQRVSGADWQRQSSPPRTEARAAIAKFLVQLSWLAYIDTLITEKAKQINVGL
jgi:hypothetical protein